MYKLVILLALVAVSAAAPAPSAVLAYSSPALVSPVVSSVVSPAVTSYSSYSHGVVHGSPLVSSVVPVVHSPVVHTVPLTYSRVVQPVLL